MDVPRARGLVAVVLVAAAVFLGAFGLTRLGHNHSGFGASDVPQRPQAAPALGAVTAPPTAAGSVDAGAPSRPTAVRHQLASAVGEPGLGGRLLARIVDARTGAVLYDSSGDTPAAPASTGKLLTAAAILAVHKPSDRFTTKIVDGANGTLVIVGGGDPTLSAAAAGRSSLYPDAARMSDLVAQVKQSGFAVRRILVDGTLFAGPSISPSWDPTDMGTSYGAPITAFMADGGRPSPKAQARSGVQPDIDAAHELAAMLDAPDVPVGHGRAPAGAKLLASVRSAPLSELITQMLQESDNTIADVLARQVAVAEKVTASFAGATAAIRTVLARFGVQVGAGMKDGSGLASGDRVSPAALVGVLRLVTGATGPPAAAQLHFIAGALPVGGWSGTLLDRYTSGGLAGDVRAKTGTLSTVSSLAGFVHDRSGRLLVFALDADRAVGTFAAEAALDDVVRALAQCGCR